MYYWQTEQLRSRPLALGDESAIAEIMKDWPGRLKVRNPKEWSASETAIAALTQPMPSLPVERHVFRYVIEARDDGRIVATCKGTIAGDSWYGDYDAVLPSERGKGYYRALRLSGMRWVASMGIRYMWWHTFAGSPASEAVRHLDRAMSIRLDGVDSFHGQQFLRMTLETQSFTDWLATQPEGAQRIEFGAW